MQTESIELDGQHDAISIIDVTAPTGRDWSDDFIDDEMGHINVQFILRLCALFRGQPPNCRLLNFHFYDGIVNLWLRCCVRIVTAL